VVQGYGVPRQLVTDALMRPVPVVKTLERANDAVKALDAEQDQVPQTLLPRTPDPTFGERIRIRYVVGCLDGFHAGVGQHSVEPTREALVTVVEQEPRLDASLLAQQPRDSRNQRKSGAVEPPRAIPCHPILFRKRPRSPMARKLS